MSVPPVERVRARLAASAGPAVAELLPHGYQRLGDLLLVRLPPELRLREEEIARAYREELKVRGVLVREDIRGEYRSPRARWLGPAGDPRTLHQEGGLRWRLDASRVMFSPGNRRERERVAEWVRPGERVGDLFAGIGYFTLPLARSGRTEELWAVEKNPESFRFLEENLELNGLAHRVRTVLGDNRTAELPRGHFDRLLLGYLPSSLPYLPRALELLQPAGGYVHAHFLAGAEEPEARTLERFAERVELAEGRLLEARLRTVKSYGPGRRHVVADARVARR